MKKIYDKPEIAACWVFIYAGDYKRAIEAGKLAVEKYPKDSEAYLCLGLAYYNVGELKLALENLKKAESLTSNKEDLMGIYNIIGQILYRMGYLDALLYYSRSLNLAKDLGNKDLHISILNNIADIYKGKGELDKALSYYEEALSLQTNEEAKALTYNNIASLYSKKGDNQKAVEYFQKAVEIYEKYGDYHSVAMVKLNLGDLYREMKDYEKAEKYLFEGLEGVKKMGDKYWEAAGYGSLGFLYKDKGDKKTAREYLTRAYNLLKSIGAELYALGVLMVIKELDKSN
jgi:tetratricopeptide (TPR) repeat protein